MKGIAILILAFFQVLGMTTNSAHDFHLSKGSLKYKKDQKAVQLSLHIYIDDFERALSEMGVDSLYILTTKESEEADKYIGLYLKQKFQLAFDEKPIEFEYLGKELDDDLAGMWVYMEALEIEPPQNAEIAYTVLLNTFDDQKNILSVQINDKSDHLMFSDVDRKKILKWKQ